ncbi:MAG: ABC transporter permease [Oscillospiraceae bacterium]|nr:ABC transporter permease [Oscillospiraceae bacterium]
MNKVRKLGLSLLNSLLPVLCAFAIGAVIILIIGQNPLTTYWIMIKNTLFTWKGFMKTLHYASPLILTGLAIAITFKANIFNMGVEGQLLGGAFASCIIGFSLKSMNPTAHVIICLLSGIIVGMLFALVPAILKAYFHVNEMVVTLMLNYAIAKILQVLASTVFRDKAAGYVATSPIESSAMFNRIGGTSITLFFPITIVVFIAMYFVFKKSRLGYEITAIGRNTEFAEASGMNVRRKIIYMMLISGALSGLAGAGFMMSEKFKYTLDFSGSPGLGWDGMLIALLGGHDPIGILIAAVFYSALKTGSDSIGIFANVPKEIVAVIQGLMILFLSIRFIDQRTKVFENFKTRFISKKAQTEEVQ